MTNERSFELGIGKVDPWTDSGGWNTSYYHTDMIGTTRVMTDFVRDPGGEAVFTAFGELRPNGTNHRYGYAGAWGYQAHEEFPFLHVGARYYDPSTGRFLQRDPKGFVDGSNLYESFGANPLFYTDPFGYAVDTAKVLQSLYANHPELKHRWELLAETGWTFRFGNPGFIFGRSWILYP